MIITGSIITIISIVVTVITIITRRFSTMIIVFTSITETLFLLLSFFLLLFLIAVRALVPPTSKNLKSGPINYSHMIARESSVYGWETEKIAWYRRKTSIHSTSLQFQKAFERLVFLMKFSEFIFAGSATQSQKKKERICTLRRQILPGSLATQITQHMHNFNPR